jgi:hypothetical protein
VSDRVIVAVAVQVFVEIVWCEGAAFAKKACDARRAFRFAALAGSRQDLNPVAGRNYQALAQELAVNELTQTVTAHLVAEGELLAHLDGSAPVI